MNIVYRWSYEIQKENEDRRLSYSEQLCTFEWKFKRVRIIRRDGEKCTVCGKPPTSYINGEHFRNFTQEELEKEKLYVEERQKLLDKEDVPFKIQVAVRVGGPVAEPSILHVHHKYYILNQYAWEYDDSALVAMCHLCHAEVHKNHSIPVYTDASLLHQVRDLTPCPRCYGAGVFLEYNHVDNGICNLP